MASFHPARPHFHHHPGIDLADLDFRDLVAPCDETGPSTITVAGWSVGRIAYFLAYSQRACRSKVSGDDPEATVERCLFLLGVERILRCFASQAEGFQQVGFDFVGELRRGPPCGRGRGGRRRGRRLRRRIGDGRGRGGRGGRRGRGVSLEQATRAPPLTAAMRPTRCARVSSPDRSPRSPPTRQWAVVHTERNGPPPSQSIFWAECVAHGENYSARKRFGHGSGPVGGRSR